MRRFLRINMAAVLTVFFISNQSYAQSKRGVSDPFSRSIAEYFYSKTGDEILKPVKLIGGVDLPGIYHIPKNTDLTTLLSISGGVETNGDINNILYTPAGQKTREIDLYDHVNPGKEIFLNAGDTIFIPKKEAWISTEMATTITVIVSVISLGLTAYVVDRAD